ncbi:MAG TPA: hypothetical protein VHX65_10410 [Pirellulales bacterium]|nr:hypothetical protein [Pirellulales bacterium]
MLLAAQTARLEDIETNLASQVDALLRSAADGLAADAEALQYDFARRDQSLADRLREHETLIAEFRRQQHDLARKSEDIEAARIEAADVRQSLVQAQADLQREAEELARSRGRCKQLEERLSRESEQLEVRREQTKDQRRRIAQELKAERDSQQHEVGELRRTIEQLRSQQQRGADQAIAELRQKRDELESLRRQHQHDVQRQKSTLDARAAELDSEAARLETVAADMEGKSAEFHAARELLDARESALSNQKPSAAAVPDEQLRQLNESLADARHTSAAATATASELSQTVDDLRQSHERLRESAEVSEQRHGELQHKYQLLEQEYQNLRRSPQPSSDSAPPAGWATERDALIARVAEAEHQLSQLDLQRLEDSQRRFEMAVADVRDLKRRNSELEEQLMSVRAAGGDNAWRRPQEDAVLDWEATKRRMLESLESDNGPVEAEQLLTVESTIQITDEIVSSKDREITELRMLLSQQSSNIGAVAVGAAAIAESFNQDELIQQEREKLRLLQEEWREKLRQAEIDISIERARIARQKVEIEEKVSAYDSVRAQHHADDAADPTSTAKQPTRGRWLTRLGLKEDSA